MNKHVITGTLVGMTLLGTSTAALADAAEPAGVADGTVSPSPLTQTVAQQTRSLVTVANVQGSFSFDQSTVTPNATIKEIFQKASAALCNVASAQESFFEEFLISVGGDVPSPYDTTLSQIEKEQGTTAQVMGCSCTSNSIGGWAIANARVEGASIESIAARAGL